MHLVFPDHILHTPPFDEAVYQFQLPKRYPEWIDVYDFSRVYKDQRVSFKKAYANILHSQSNNKAKEAEKLQREYSESFDEELENALFHQIFQEILNRSKKEDKEKRYHLENVSSLFVLEKVQQYYQDMGYFDQTVNAFVVPNSAKITLGVHINSLLYSTKDTYVLAEALFDSIPAPRTPAHQKRFFSGVNSGIIARLRVDLTNIPLSISMLRKLVQEEKISLTRLAGLLSGYKKIGGSPDFHNVHIAISPILSQEELSQEWHVASRRQSPIVFPSSSEGHG